MIPAGALILLDTDILLHLVRGDVTGLRIATEYRLLERPERPLVSIVSVGEILTFAQRRAWGAAKVETLNGLLRELVVVPISGQAMADLYAQIIAFSQAQGRNLGDNDGWIAATAAGTKAVLLSSDKDFDILDPLFIKLERVLLET